MMTQLLPNPAPHLICRDISLLAFMLDHKRSNNLAIPLVRQAGHTNLANSFVRKKTILDFERVDVFAALDDEVLDAACDANIAVSVHSRFVTGMHPHDAVIVGDHDFRCLLLVAPVPLHEQVSAHGELATLVDT